MPRRSILLAVVFVWLAVGTGCKSPGTTGEQCQSPEFATPDGGATAAQAAGGQRSSVSPDVQDIGAPNPVTTIGRGAGATSNTSAYQADKTANGSLAVNQSWTADSQAIAEALKDAPPAVLAARELAATLNAQLAAAVPGSPEAAALADRVERLIRVTSEANAEFFRGLASLRPDFRGSVLVQVVLAGSAVNGKAVDPANAAAAAAGVPATIDAAGRAVGPVEPLPAPPAPDPGMGG